MGIYSKKVDAYIAKSAPFARPILEYLRDLVHRTVPEAEETVKWGFPHFEYKGIICNFAAFKQHCSFGFWKASIMDDPKNILNAVGKTSMGHLGRITSLDDLPADKILVQYLKKAVQLNEDDIRVEKPKPKAAPKVNVPDFFLKEMARNKKAMDTFEGFSNSQKKEYVEWIEDAKTDATRQKRMETAIEWMAEGKVRNWKYIKN